MAGSSITFGLSPPPSTNWRPKRPRWRQAIHAATKAHPRTRLLASVYKAITERVPASPDHADFRLGKTLGRDYGNWRRVKKGLPERYRLFFRFASKPVKLIVYVWFNDEDTLRKAGSKTDVYETFRRMLARGEVPDSIDHLLRESRKSG